METVQTKTTTHPLFIAAAGSIILFSALGSAAIMGWIPKGGAESVSSISQTPATNTPAALVSTPVAATPTVVATPQPVASPAPRVAARVEPRPAPRAPARPAVQETATPVTPVAMESHVSPPVEIQHTDNNRDNNRDNHRIVLAQASDLPPSPPARVAAPVCRECGVIESVNEIEKAGEGSGLGAVAGGVVGAIAGKQVGGGRGRNVMSVLGAVGGAFAGNAIEKNARTVKSYDVTIRFEDGSSRTLSQANPPIWRTGDRVRLINGAIQPNA